MEQPIERRFENLSLSSPSFYPATEEPTEKQEELQNIRISLYSRFPDYVESVAAAIIREAQGLHLRVCGPRVLPNLVFYITTRLTTREHHCTRDFEKQLYGRAIDVLSSTGVVEEIISHCDNCLVNYEFEVVDLGAQIQ
ncbi:small ribosomal subunit protein uS10z/uS10x-like [Apium graveolens]|uniref:small ribosomal subunit protein uS10z/uS10x-like n=1 Tax=Apium graveolens TaxID=4045 RepID=UPI003D7997D4